MAITTMVSKERAIEVNFENIKIVNDYPGVELFSVHHNCSKCPCRNGQKDMSGKLSRGCCAGSQYKDGKLIAKPSCGSSYCSGCYVTTEPLYMETSYIGKVLETREKNGYDDSDFYAVVWDDYTQSTKDVYYASTRGWTYPNHAEVDATPEVREAYNKYVEKSQAEYRQKIAEKELKTPRAGKSVRVIGGRKVANGLEGLVFWYGPDKYQRNNMRVGVHLCNGEKVFISAVNVEVI